MGPIVVLFKLDQLKSLNINLTDINQAAIENEFRYYSLSLSHNTRTNHLVRRSQSNSNWKKNYFSRSKFSFRNLMSYGQTVIELGFFLLHSNTTMGYLRPCKSKAAGKKLIKQINPSFSFNPIPKQQRFMNKHERKVLRLK